MHHKFHTATAAMLENINYQHQQTASSWQDQDCCLETKIKTATAWPYTHYSFKSCHGSLIWLWCAKTWW